MSTETKAVHTPGPWRSDWETDEFIVGSNTCGPVARICDDNGYPESEANARLISACPDMLKALKELCKHYCELKYSGPLWQAAEAAIRKAEVR